MNEPDGVYLTIISLTDESQLIVYDSSTGNLRTEPLSRPWKADADGIDFVDNYDGTWAMYRQDDQQAIVSLAPLPEGVTYGQFVDYLPMETGHGKDASGRPGSRGDDAEIVVLTR